MTIKKDRVSIRLKDFDYTREGYYFVTICVQNKKCLFGKIENASVVLNDFGREVETLWREIPDHFANVELDETVVMPNHLHGIIVIKGRGTACRARQKEAFGNPVSGSLPTIIRSFKSAVTKHFNSGRKSSGKSVWQKNFYEHIVRSEEELRHIREYIANNPLKWETDRENPENSLKKFKKPDEPWKI